MVQNEKGMSIRLKAERSEMPVMMPGSAIGRMSSSEIASRPKNLRARQRRGGERAEDQASSVAISGDARPTAPSASQMSCAVPGDGEPFQRQPGRRELVARSSVVKA